MAVYHYYGLDVLTGTRFAELPFYGVTFGGLLNNPGSFEGWLNVADPAVARASWVDATEPQRTAILVERDGVPVWYGPIWNRRYMAGTKQVAVSCGDLWSYWRSRYLRQDQFFTNVDQLTIIQTVLNLVQSYPNGNVMVIGSETSGVLRTINYFGYAVKEIGALVEEAAQIDNGFDFSIGLAYTGVYPNQTLSVSFNLWYPRKGRNHGQVGTQVPTFTYSEDGSGMSSGNIVSYEWPEDGKSSGNTEHALGKGDGYAMLISDQSSAPQLQAGYPLIERVVSYKDEDVQANLDARCRADVAAFAQPVTLPTMTVRADVPPIFGEWTVGDDCRIVVEDPRFPNGLDSYKRIIGWQLTPGDAGQDSLLLTMGTPP